jgi:hypothetical protein
MDLDTPQEQDAMDADLVGPSRCFHWWQRGRKAEREKLSTPCFHWWQGGKKAEYEKLMSHIVVLRKRVRRLRSVRSSDGQSTCVQHLVDQALQDRSWHCGGEQAHRYADSLEEFVVLIEHEPYLTVVMNHELSHADPGERITLETLFEKGDLQALMVAYGTEEPPRPARSLCRKDVAEVLRLLFQKRADLMRHDRLMGRLRQYYLPGLLTIIGILLILTILAILKGQSNSFNSMRPWAELLAATFLGALGGTLSATLKLRDIAELNSFRVVATYLFVQPWIGGAFGFVSWLILASGMITVGSPSSWKTRAVVAFAVGFSEPFFVGILGRVMGLTTPASNRRGSAGAGSSPSSSIDSTT